MEEDIFYKVPKNLVRAKGYVSPRHGTFLKLSSTEKLVYVYMRDRLKFFVGKQGGQHFESQQTIADACGMEYKAVGKALRGFINNGVLLGKKGKEAGSSHHRYYYAGIEDLTLWVGTEGEEKLLTTEKLSGKVEESKECVRDDAPLYWGDDSGPF